MSSSISEAIREKILGALEQTPVVEEVAAETATDSDLQVRLKTYAQLENWRRELEDALKLCKSESERLAPGIMEDMTLAGLEHARVDGLTLYVQTSVFVNKLADKDGVTTEMVCEALKECGLGYMVKDGYSASSLKAKVLEWKEAGADIPERLAALLRVTEVPKLITRR